MKTLKIALVALAAMLTCSNVVGQGQQDMSGICKEEMSKVSYLIGKWKGRASYTRGPGQTIELQQEETIVSKLNGTLLLIEGVGRNGDNVAFHALGVLNFDPYNKEFKFKSYLKEGQMTDAYFKVVAEDKFEWGFEVPGGKLRYTIALNRTEKSWNEVGEYSQDGTQWYQTTKLNLTKIE